MPTFGIGIPNFGPTLDEVAVLEMARLIEHAGFDGIWLTDHILIPDVIVSPYPYSADGSFPLPKGGTWYEAVTTLAFIAGATEHIELGIGVCVLPLREPRLLAAQLATLDRLSGGRLCLGVGVGWMKEEFEALEVPFRGRGQRFEDSLAVLRACWTGAPVGGAHGSFTIPEGVNCRPVPAGRIPVLLGGHSPRALQRVVDHCDGWYAAIGPDDDGAVGGVAATVATLADLCDAAGRDPSSLAHGARVAIRASTAGSAATQDLLGALVEAGVGRLTIDFGWHSLEHGREVLDGLSSSIRDLRGLSVTGAR